LLGTSLTRRGNKRPELIADAIGSLFLNRKLLSIQMNNQLISVNQIFRITISIVLLLLGIGIYWLFQPDIYLFSIFQINNLDPLVVDNLFFRLLRNYFADIVWCIALIQSVYVLRKLRVSYYYPIILLLLPFIGEVLQAVRLIPGTFDWVDIAIYLALYVIFFHKEVFTMNNVTKNVVGSIVILIFAVALIGSTSNQPQPIDYTTGTFTFPNEKDEIFTKPSLSKILKSSDKLSIVLRVPAPGGTVTAEQKQKDSVLYNIIEKEFAKAGFIVRDRALFAKVLEQETQDYKKIEHITETDLILELLSYNLKQPYRTKLYRDEKGKMQEAPIEITFYGARVEFKLTSVKENDMVGSYTFNYTPCTEGCKHKFSSSRRAKGTWIVKKPIPKDFFINSSRRLIQELGR
jgi:hypothetical protein